VADKELFSVQPQPTITSFHCRVRAHTVAVQFPPLADRLFIILSNALAANTKRSYASAYNQFLIFCHQFHISPGSACEITYCFYAAWLSLRPSINAYSTISKYFTAIRDVHIASGFASPFPPMVSLARALKGLKKELSQNTKPRYPVTVGLLWAIREFWEISPEGELCWWASVFATFAVARSGELFSSSSSRSTPNLCDVRIAAHNVYGINLKKSKTDLFNRAKFTLWVAANNNQFLCPVRAIKFAIANRPLTLNAPLWLDSLSKPLSLGSVLKHLHLALTRAGISTTGYSGHSFRKGGVQTLYDLHVPADDIELLGRWAARVWSLYRDMSIERLIEISCLMVSHCVSQKRIRFAQ
jgi:hypothetical protein